LDLDPNPDSDTNLDLDPNLDSDANPDLDPNRYAYDHTDADPNPDPITDQHIHQNAAAYRDVNRYPDPNRCSYAIMA
jgi:hypothetical protein